MIKLNRRNLYHLIKPPMDGRFLFLSAFLLGICLCPLSLLALQTSSYEALPTVHLSEGVLKQSPRGKRLLLQVKEPQKVKTETEKERKVKQNAHKQDATVAHSDLGASLDKDLPAGSGHDNATANVTKPGDEGTHSSSIPPPPPPAIDKEAETTPVPENKRDVSDSVPNVDKGNDTSLDMDSQKPAMNCGGSHCEDPKMLMSACLSIPGDGAHKLSLLITYEGDGSVVIKVTAPEFLKADPPEVSVSKGKSETIHFSMDSKYEDTSMYSEAMQNKTIVVTTPHGHCEIDVPMEYLLNSAEERVSPFIPLVEPRVIAYLLMFVVFISCVGAWLCYKCRGKKRAGDVKYQQLEMNGVGPSTPKERVEDAGDGWDEVWDDDWEDTEAAKSSSRLSQSLSSRGLAARRGAKDGRDNGWDD